LVVEAARYRLGRHSRESFRRLARALLLDGSDEAVPLLQVRTVPSDRAAVAFERFCERVGQPIPSVDHALRITVTAVLSDVESATLAADRALGLIEELRQRSPESSVWSAPLRE
jgi:hypothetical protein